MASFTPNAHVQTSPFLPQPHPLKLTPPPGSGKSTLLSVLAGDLSDGLQLDGFVLLGGVAVADLPRGTIGYCAQDDVLTPTLTPLEAVRFAATLRLPRNVPEATRRELSAAILCALGLEGVANSLIGSRHAGANLARPLARPLAPHATLPQYTPHANTPHTNIPPHPHPTRRRRRNLGRRAAARLPRRAARRCPCGIARRRANLGARRKLGSARRKVAARGANRYSPSPSHHSLSRLLSHSTLPLSSLTFPCMSITSSQVVASFPDARPPSLFTSPLTSSHPPPPSPTHLSSSLRLRYFFFLTSFPPRWSPLPVARPSSLSTSRRADFSPPSTGSCCSPRSIIVHNY